MNTEKYYYPEGCKEISGFGGGYEEACRKMVIAGITWLSGQNGEKIKFSGFEGVFGLITAENETAKQLEKIMIDAAGGDCTGAMLHACVNHVSYAYAHGWEDYIKHMEGEEK